MKPTRERNQIKGGGARNRATPDSGQAKEPFLDKFLSISGQRLEGLSVALLAAYRGIADTARQRRRREEDTTALRTITDTVLANLVYQFLATGHRKTPIVVQMRKATAKQTRYDRANFEKLQAVVKGLAAAGEIGLKIGSQRGKASTIWAGSKLARRIADLKPTYGDLRRLPSETIILSRNGWSFADGIKRDGSRGPVRSKRSDRVDYTDTRGPGGTIAARRRLGALSAWLTDADVKFSKPGHRLDTTSVTLTRRFTLTDSQTARGFKFTQNGRLQDGWWMQVRKEDRRFILINGENVADLDYSAMFIRLGCIKAGIKLDAETYPYGLPGLNRDAVKTVMLAMMFADKPRSKLPPEAAKMLPKGMTMASIREAIAKHRPEIMPIFEKGWGLQLMHRESEVMMALLEALKEKRIVALPMHDGVMMQRSRATVAQRVMNSVSEEMLGTVLPVKRKPVEGVD
jgi:hypothetical protein